MKTPVQLLTELRDAVWDNLIGPTDADTANLFRVMTEVTRFLEQEQET